MVKAEIIENVVRAKPQHDVLIDWVPVGDFENPTAIERAMAYEVFLAVHDDFFIGTVVMMRSVLRGFGNVHIFVGEAPRG